jgi:hypothetical protein
MKVGPVTGAMFVKCSAHRPWRPNPFALMTPLHAHVSFFVDEPHQKRTMVTHYFRVLTSAIAELWFSDMGIMCLATTYFLHITVKYFIAHLHIPQHMHTQYIDHNNFIHNINTAT